ncbi:MAG: hypothetical protein WAN03_13925 [Candidatus Sulfotelmatobacter sp.]
MRIFLFAGLLEIALGAAFLAAPVPGTEILEVRAGDAIAGVENNHSERVSPLIGFVLLASGIALTVAGTPARISKTRPVSNGQPSQIPRATPANNVASSMQRD